MRHGVIYIYIVADVAPQLVQIRSFDGLQLGQRNRVSVGLDRQRRFMRRTIGGGELFNGSFAFINEAFGFARVKGYLVGFVVVRWGNVVVFVDVCIRRGYIREVGLVDTLEGAYGRR